MPDLFEGIPGFGDGGRDDYDYRRDRDLKLKRERAEADGTLLSICQGDWPVITTRDLVSQRMAILGGPGTGKSNTFTRIFEELYRHKCGGTIIDIEGQFWSLAGEFQILKIGKTSYCDKDVDPSDAPALAAMAYEEQLPVLLDFSGHTNEHETTRFLTRYFEKMFEHAAGKKIVHMIGVDEAREFFPQDAGFHSSEEERRLRDVFKRVAARGRTKGLGMVLSTQRSAAIDKNVLAMCGIQFLHAATDPTDFNVYKARVGESLGKAQELRGILDRFGPGDALVFVRGAEQAGGRWFKSHILSRDSFDVGYTPTEIGEDVAPEIPLVRVSGELLHRLELEVTSNDGKKREENKFLRIERRCLDLEELVNRKEEEARALTQTIAALKGIKATVDPTALAQGIATGVAVALREVLPTLPAPDPEAPAEDTPDRVATDMDACVPLLDSDDPIDDRSLGEAREDEEEED